MSRVVCWFSPGAASAVALITRDAGGSPVLPHNLTVDAQSRKAREQSVNTARPSTNPLGGNMTCFHCLKTASTGNTLGLRPIGRGHKCKKWFHANCYPKAVVRARAIRRRAIA